MKERCANCARILAKSQFSHSESIHYGLMCDACVEFPICNKYIRDFQTIKKYLEGEEISGYYSLKARVNSEREQFEQWVRYICEEFGPDYEYTGWIVED